MTNPTALTSKYDNAPLPQLIVGLCFFVTIAAWLPWQGAVYLVPFFVVVLLFVMFSTQRIPPRRALRALIPLVVLCLVATWGGINALLGGATPLHPALWLITHGSFTLAALGLSLSAQQAQKMLRVFIDLNIVVGVVEIVIGFYQFAEGPSFAETSAAGDFVFGTFSGNSHLYALKMLVLAGASYALWRQKSGTRYLLGAAMLMQGWLLASAMHTVLVAGGALLIYHAIEQKQVVRTAQSVVVFVMTSALVVACLYVVQERNIRYMVNKLSLTNVAHPDQASYGKVEFFQRTVVIMPQEHGAHTALLGVGAGAYSSRASWILSGEYLQTQGMVPTAPAPLWSEYLEELWNHDLLSKHRWAHGVANQPMSSWVSILGEFGYLGITCSLLGMARLTKRFVWGLRHSSEPWIGGVALLVAIIIAIAMLFDNWVEYPQVAMPIIVIIALSYRALQNSGTTFVPAHVRGAVSSDV